MMDDEIVITVRPPNTSFAAFTKVFAPASVTADPRPSASAKRVGSKLAVQPHQRARKRIRAERLQVLRLFAYANKMDRYVIAFGDGDQHAALGRAVELGHYEAGHAGRVAEGFHLAERILADSRIENQDHVVWRGGVDLADGAHHLGELVHKLRLVLQAPGRVD